MPEPCFVRLPSIRADRVSFVADDDVWLCAATGGVARRLTADHAPITSTYLSPDGSLVAFSGQRDGGPEVYVVGTDGGPVRRLSWFGSAGARVVGWRGDGEVLAVSSAGEPFSSRTWAYALPVAADGPPERLGYGPVTAIASQPGGGTVLGVNQSRHRGAAWKRYRGGTAAALWIDRDGSGSFERFLTALDG
ncbi:MAG TPA: hypothetical protein VMD59_00880, partial [Acidimicrobiales bacterium]|nr:hypothetical protein [Acidimicrobiales bacterium]